MQGTLFALHAFILHMLIVTVPGLSLLYYSFTDWNGLMVTRMVGLENFKRAMTSDPDFMMAMMNTLKWTGFFLIVPVVIGLVVALGIVKMRKSQMLLRALLFLPYVISPIVVGRIFSAMYSPYAGIGALFEALGLNALKNYAPLGDMNLALYFVAMADCWHWWGFVMVLFLSALHQVNPDLYEQADIEGASPIRKLWHVTIPSILPTIVTLYMIIIIGSFLTFDYVFVMTNEAPAGHTEILSTWIYKRTFVGYEAGYGCSLSLIVCSVCVVVYIAFQKLQKLLARKGIEI